MSLSFLSPFHEQKVQLMITDAFLMDSSSESSFKLRKSSLGVTEFFL